MGVGGETLCCERERALSVQNDAGKIPEERTEERKVQCSKICVRVLRCHCKLSEVSLVANAELLPANGIVELPRTCSFGPLRIHGTGHQASIVSTAYALSHTTNLTFPFSTRRCPFLSL